MFVIFTLLFTTVLAQSHEKYIDLLSEEEKQQFLEKVARRMMGTIKNVDDRNEFNKELIGDQEGAQLLRRRRADYKSSEEKNDAEENSDDTPLNSNKDAHQDSDSTSNDENVSSSVEIKRRNYETSKKKSDEVIQNSNVKTDSRSKEKETVEQLFDQKSKREELQTEKLKDPETSTVNFATTTEQSAEITSTAEELLTDVTNSIAFTTYEPNDSGDENDINVKKTTNNIKSSLKTKSKSRKKITVEPLPSKKSNEEESPTEKFKKLETSTADFNMLTEEQADMISTTEYQDLISEVTHYTTSITSKPNESNDEEDPNIMKVTNHDKDDEVTENVRSITEGESNEKKLVESNDKSKEEELPEKVKTSETADIIATTESQDLKNEEINYTAYDPTTYEPNLTGDANDQHSKEDNKAKITAKPILLLEVDSNFTTATINMKEKNPVRHKSVVNNINDEDSVLTTEYLNEESTLGLESEQTFAHAKTSNIPDSSLDDEVKRDDSTTGEVTTRSISLDYDHTISVSSATEVYVATTVNYPATSEDRTPKIAITASTTQATVLPTLPPVNAVSHNKTPKKTRFKIITKSEQNTLDINNVKKVKLDNGLKEKNLKSNDVTTERSGLPRYQVYEIPWPDSSENPPFLKSDEPMKKLPFPVYKNLPNYLQYNPTNHNKPNVKINTIGHDGRRQEIVENSTNVTSSTVVPLVGLPDTLTNKDGDIRKFGVYKKQPKQYEEEPTSPNNILSPEDKNFEQQNTVNRPNDQKISDLLIANYVENKNSHIFKRMRMLTSTNASQEDMDLSTIAKILKLTDEKDVFPALDKMQELNFKLMRRNDDVKISIYLKALSDLIEQDSKALRQYDWLATTVQIQSALEKIFLLIHKMHDSQPIHPADLQILKYAMFLHNYLIELKRAKNFKTKLKEYVKLLSRDKRGRRNRDGADTRLLHKVWEYIRKLLPDSTANDGLNNLNEFLLDVEKGLYDLHQAIKGVSIITKFKHQNWFTNLRQLYLTTNEKHLLQLLLHISFSRLVELVEHSCEKGLEENFITYMKSHKKESKRTLEDMVFVIMVIDEIKSGLE